MQDVAYIAGCRARFVVGADGVRSAIRASMFPADPGPRYLVSGDRGKAEEEDLRQAS